MPQHGRNAHTGAIHKWELITDVYAVDEARRRQAKDRANHLKQSAKPINKQNDEQCNKQSIKPSNKAKQQSKATKQSK